MTYILICDGCGKAKIEPMTEGNQSWRTYQAMDEEFFIAGALKGRPFELHFHNEECALEGLKKLYQHDLDLEAYLKKHDIELE